MFTYGTNENVCPNDGLCGKVIKGSIMLISRRHSLVIFCSALLPFFINEIIVWPSVAVWKIREILCESLFRRGMKGPRGRQGRCQFRFSDRPDILPGENRARNFSFLLEIYLLPSRRDFRNDELRNWDSSFFRPSVPIGERQEESCLFQ